jgi:hypothetical protein
MGRSPIDSGAKPPQATVSLSKLPLMRYVQRMAKPVYSSDEIESENLLTKTGRVKPAGLLNAKKPTLRKFGATKANGLPRKQRTV